MFLTGFLIILINVMDIQNLIVRISKLTQKEQNHFYRILIKNGVTYSKNLNGYFFNLGKANNDVLEELTKCLELIEPNRDLIKQLDSQRQELREKYTFIIKQRLTQHKQKILQEFENKITVEPYTNVKVEIHPVQLRQKVYIKEDEDIESVMKRLRKKNYPKNSIYHTVLQKIKRKNTNKKKISTEENDDDNYSINIIDNDPNDNEYNFDDNDNNDLENEIEELENETEDLEHEVEEIENDIVESDDVDMISEHDQEIELNQETEIKEESNEELQEQILYYRKILSQQLGFQFDENKYCKLVYQEYIPKNN